MPTQIINNNIWSNPSRTVQVSYETKNRTLNSIELTLTFKYILNSSEGYSGYAAYVTPTINGSTKSKVTLKESSPSSWYDSPISIEKSYTITGLSYSTTSISLSCLFETKDPEDSNKTLKASISIPDFKKASVLGNIANFTFDDSYGVSVPINVPVTKYVSSFYDCLTVSCGSTVIATRNGFSSGNVNLSESEVLRAYSVMSSSNSATWTFKLITYTSSSGSAVGSPSTKTATATISSTGRAPTFSSSKLSHIDVNENTIAITNDSRIFIKGFSSLKITTTAATANKGASIKSYTFTNSGTTKTLTAAGSVTFPAVSSNQYNVVVKDSRGNTSSASVTIPSENWLEYTSPSFNKAKVTVKRVEPDNTGTTVKIAVEGTYFDWGELAQTNTIQTLKYRYKESSASDDNYCEWVNLIPTTNANGHFVYEPTNQSGTFDIDKAYVFEFEATDKLSQTSPLSITLLSAEPALYINVDNNTVGIGEIFSGDAAEHSLSLKNGIKLGKPLGCESGGTGLTSFNELRNNVLSAIYLGQFSDEENLNNALDDIYGNYEAENTANITWLDSDGWRWFAVLTRSSVNTASVMAHSAVNNGSMKIKQRLNGVWQDFEWVNPPMLIGKEYKTTERFNGNPVYTKLISHTFSDGLSGVANYNIPHGLNGTFNIIDVKIYTSGYFFPYITSSTSLAPTSYTSSNLVFTNANSSWGANRTWYFTMKYTKG